jgi:hypothetical protein
VKFKPEQVRDFDPGEMGGIQPPQFKTWTGRHTVEITTGKRRGFRSSVIAPLRMMRFQVFRPQVEENLTKQC